MISVNYSYTRTTPEDAEIGEPSEIGFVGYAGARFPLRDSDGFHKSALDDCPEVEPERATLAVDSIRATIGSVSHVEVNGRDLTVYGESECIDFGTGTEEQLAAHVKADPRLIKVLARELES